MSRTAPASTDPASLRRSVEVTPTTCQPSPPSSFRYASSLSGIEGPREPRDRTA